MALNRANFAAITSQIAANNRPQVRQGQSIDIAGAVNSYLDGKRKAEEQQREREKYQRFLQQEDENKFNRNEFVKAFEAYNNGDTSQFLPAYARYDPNGAADFVIKQNGMDPKGEFGYLLGISGLDKNKRAKLIIERLRTLAKTPEALYTQSYQTALGKGAGTLPYVGSIEQHKMLGQRGVEQNDDGTVSYVPGSKEWEENKKKSEEASLAKQQLVAVMDDIENYGKDYYGVNVDDFEKLSGISRIIARADRAIRGKVGTAKNINAEAQFDVVKGDLANKAQAAARASGISAISMNSDAELKVALAGITNAQNYSDLRRYAKMFFRRYATLANNPEQQLIEENAKEAKVYPTSGVLSNGIKWRVKE